MSKFVKDKRFYRTFLTLTFAIALQNLIVFSVNLADGIMVGAYSETALSGVAIVNQIQFLLQMIVTGFAEGMIVLTSQYWGKKQIEPIKKIFSCVLFLGILSSFVLTIVVFFFPHSVLGLLTNDKAVVAQGVKYIKIICFTYCIFAITNIAIGVLRSVQTVKIGFYVNISTLIVDIILNYLLIYGKFGFPELGVEGAAIATLIARIIECVIVLSYLLFLDKKLQLKLSSLFSLHLSYLKDFLRSGFPIVLSKTSWGIAMSVQIAILGRLGGSAIAASSIATTIFQVVTVIAYGSSNASGILIGKTVGEGKIKEVKEYSKTLQLLFLGIGVVTSAVLFGLKDFIVSVYRVSPETHALAEWFILILCVTVIGTAYQMPCLTGIVAGGGDTKFVFYNDIIFMWLIVLPLSISCAFVFHLPSIVVFACLKSDQILKCAVAVVKVNRFRWIRVLTRA